MFVCKGLDVLLYYSMMILSYSIPNKVCFNQSSALTDGDFEQRYIINA